MKRRALLLFALLIGPSAFAVGPTAVAAPDDEAPVSRMVIGGVSQYLLDAADALRVGDAERAIRLSLLGLDESPSLNDRIGALSNLCGAYTMIEQYELAATRCSDAIDLDPRWQAYHNRALAYMHLHRLDDAAHDIAAGFALFPESKLLAKAQAALEEMKHAPKQREIKRTVA